jgi:O-antigen/teichoic acid export membrane protein
VNELTGACAQPPPPPATARSLVTGTLTKYGALVVSLGIGMFLMPFTLAHLGQDQYGLWMLVASITYYFQLLDLGYGNGLVRHVSAADARGTPDEVNRILSTFFVVYSAIGGAAAVAGAAMMVWLIPHFPNLTAAQIRDARWLLAFMALRVAIGFPMSVLGSVTVARQRFALNNVVATLASIANGLVTYMVLKAGFGLVPLVAATTSLAIAMYVVYGWAARRAFPPLRITPGSFSRALVREVTAFSAYVFIIDVAIQIGFNLDNLVIGAALGTASVAVYAVSARLADYQRQLCNQFNGLLFPVVVRYRADGNDRALRDVMIEGTRLALVLVVGVTIALLGFGAPLVTLWMGPGFSAAIAPLYFLGLAGIVLVGQGPLGNLLLGTGRHRLVALVSLGEALANLLLSLLLVRRYGIVGVAAGTAIPVIAANLLLLVPAACRQVGIGLGEFAKRVLRPPLTGAVPALAACAVLRLEFAPPHLAAVLAEATLVLLIYAGATCAVGFDRSVRERYVAQARRIFRRPQAVGASGIEVRAHGVL